MLLGVWTWFSFCIDECFPVDYSDPAQSPEYDLRMTFRSRHIMNDKDVICCLILVTMNDSALSTVYTCVHDQWLRGYRQLNPEVALNDSAVIRTDGNRSSREIHLENKTLHPTASSCRVKFLLRCFKNWNFNCSLSVWSPRVNFTFGNIDFLISSVLSKRVSCNGFSYDYSESSSESVSLIFGTVFVRDYWSREAGEIH